MDLYIGEVFDTMGIETNGDETECLWVRIRGEGQQGRHPTESLLLSTQPGKRDGQLTL